MTTQTHKTNGTGPITEAPWVRWLLISVALGFMLLFLILPLAAVFTEALSKGWTM